MLALASVPVQATAPAAIATTGPASFAAKIVSSGEFSATLTSCGEKMGSTDGVAMMLLNEQQAFQFGFGVTGHGSPDRTIVQTGAKDSVEVSYPHYGPICPYSALTVTVTTPPGATRYLVMWAAGLDGATTFSVNGATDVTIAQGSATSLGDPEIERASAGIQVQRRVSGFNGLGVKIVQNGEIDLDVQQRAWGFWGYNDAKFVCVGTCVGPALADQACYLAAGTTCDTRLSWDGPGGTGGAGQNVFNLFGGAPGSYTFRVDSKVDAYNPGGGVYQSGVLVFPGENYGFLSLADVALPG